MWAVLVLVSSNLMVQYTMEILSEAQQYNELSLIKRSNDDFTNESLPSLIQRWQSVLQLERPPALFGSVAFQSPTA